MKVEIVVPRTIQAYRCDGSNCDVICESEYSDPRSVCTWIELTDQSHQASRRSMTESSDSMYLRWKTEATRYFCSWLCAANWAYDKARENAPVLSWQAR